MLQRTYIRNPVCLPWFIPGDLSTTARSLLEDAYKNELIDAGSPGFFGRVWLVALWFAVMARSSVIHFARHRAAIRRDLPQVGDAGHLWRLFVCVFTNNIPPHEFYHYKFYLERFYRNRRHYLMRWQLDPLLVRSIPPGKGPWMADKYLFWKSASSAGVPVVTVWALLSRGEWRLGGMEVLAGHAADLVVKPTNRARGEGVLFVDFLGIDLWSWEGRRMSSAQVARELADYSQEHDVIVQPRLRNHPELARYGNEGLATLRIVTMKTSEMTEPVCVAAALRLAHGSARLANLHKQALVSAIDLESGVLSPGAGCEPACEDLRVHPATGVPLAGERVTDWEECKRICKAGHKLVPMLNSIGWDVIIDPEGPKLLEANLRWGAPVLQIGGGPPLLRSRIPELYQARA
jgi:Sugar-transfer associated ATP-grasp